MNRFCSCLIVLLLGAVLRPAAAQPPNILLVMTDDQGYGDLSGHGNPHLQTPRLDRFAAEGVRFDRFYVMPLCAPTRAALLTGRYSLRSGVHGVTKNQETMRAEEVTLADALRAAGYRTGCFGKWHNGELFPYTAPGRGFDEFFGFNSGHINNYFDAELLRGATPEQTRGFVTDVLTDEAIRFLERNQHRPFFCYVPYNAPHMPIQAPDREFDKYQSKGLPAGPAGYYAMCDNLDENFGRLLDALDRLNLSTNTLVLFLTDNGAIGAQYNAGMKGGKGSLDEGGSRVPLFIRWPGRLGAPRVIPSLASVNDLYPTLLDLCGVTPPPGPPVDGVSLRPLLEGRPEAWPERALFTNYSGERNRGAVRTTQYRLVHAGANWQLYDLRADPGQQQDLAGARPAVVAQLSAAYDAWFADVTRNFTREPWPLPVGYAEHDPVVLTAPLAKFEGGIRFQPPPGFAHSWLTGWTDRSAQIHFDLDVVQAGHYAVTLRYDCPPEDAGATVRVRVGAAAVTGIVPPAAIREIPLPHRVMQRQEFFVNREWGILDLGQVRLEKGRARLTVEALTMPGRQVMELKEVILSRGESTQK